MQSPKVLAIHRYYWPDTAPYASLLKSIVDVWGHNGARVDVLSSYPSYNAGVERIADDGVIGESTRVFRYKLPFEGSSLFRRLLNTVKFFFLILSRAVIGRYDVIMISTSPPVVAGFSAALAARLTRSRLIYHCMDLHPEIGSLSGEFSNPYVYKVMMSMELFTCRTADRIVVLSSDMKDAVIERDASLASKTCVMNNFSLPSNERDENESFWYTEPTERKRLLFAGNIGRYQGLDRLVSAFHQGHAEALLDLELVFMGDGKALADIKELAREGQGKDAIRFIPHQPVEVAKFAMRAADFSIISLQPKVINYAFPSKTITYLEQSCPIFALVEPGCELERMISKNKLGFCADPKDEKKILDALVAINGFKGRTDCLRANVGAFYKANFDSKTVLTRWVDLLDEVASERR